MCLFNAAGARRADGTREVVVASTTGIRRLRSEVGARIVVVDLGGNKLRTVASPIESHGLVFVTGGDGGGSRNAAAVRLDGEGKLGESFVAWSGGRGFPYVPSLLASGDHLYMVHDGGIAACHSAKTGEQIWTERIGGKFSASPILVGGNVLIVNEEGQVTVFPAEPAYKAVATGTIDETVFATPAFAGGRLYIRGDTHLHCYGPSKSTTGVRREGGTVAGGEVTRGAARNGPGVGTEIVGLLHELCESLMDRPRAPVGGRTILSRTYAFVVDKQNGPGGFRMSESPGPDRFLQLIRNPSDACVSRKYRRVAEQAQPGLRIGVYCSKVDRAIPPHRNLIPLALFAALPLFGFRVADDFFGFGVPGDLAAEADGDVRQVTGRHRPWWVNTSEMALRGF